MDESGYLRVYDDVSPEEIENQIGRDDLVKETAKVFGFNRVTASIDQVVGIAISYAEQRGFVEISEDGMKVTQKQ